LNDAGVEAAADILDEAWFVSHDRDSIGQSEFLGIVEQ
jgi:hypothetical protein